MLLLRTSGMRPFFSSASATEQAAVAESSATNSLRGKATLERSRRVYQALSCSPRDATKLAESATATAGHPTLAQRGSTRGTGRLSDIRFAVRVTSSALHSGFRPPL